MNNTYDTPTIKFMYKAGLIIIIPILCIVAFLHTDLAATALFKSGLHCALKRATGIPCPGCGCTRAAYSLASFKIIESIEYNIAVFSGALFYLIFMAVELLHFKLGTRGFSEKGFFVMLYTWLSLVILHWVVRLIMTFTA